MNPIISRFAPFELPAAGDPTPPEHGIVCGVEQAVVQGLHDPAFVRQCIELEVARLAVPDSKGGLVPFCVLPASGVCLAFGYFEPGVRTAPHEHTAWTVTASCVNELEVVTFARDVAYAEGRLVTEKTILAPAVRAGHIYEPCIHLARNPSRSRSSLTLHLLSPHDGSTPADRATGFNQLFAAEHAEAPGGRPRPYDLGRAKQRSLRLLALLARSQGASETSAAAHAIVQHASLQTRRLCADLLGHERTVDVLGAAIALSDACDSLELTEQAGKLELRDTSEHPRRVVLRMSAFARAALEAMLQRRRFVPRSLPGGLNDDELLGLLEALDEAALLNLSGVLDVHPQS